MRYMMKNIKLEELIETQLKEASEAKAYIDEKISSSIAEYEGRPYGNEEDGKSQIVMKDIRKQVEWLIPNIISPFLESDNLVDATPITPDDVMTATLNENLLNYQFTRTFNRFKFLNKLSRVLATEGTVILRTGWDRQYKTTVEVLDGITIEEFNELPYKSKEIIGDYGNGIIKTKIEKVAISKNSPTASVVKNEDVYIDPLATDNLEQAEYIIYRYKTTKKALEEQEDGVDKKILEDAINSEWNDNALSNHRAIMDEEYGKLGASNSDRVVYVYEYWGKYDIKGKGHIDALIKVINGKIIKAIPNPFPDKEPPFILAPYLPVPHQLWGDSLRDLIGDNQKVRTAIYRGFINTLANSSTGQKWIPKNSLDELNKQRAITGEPIVEYSAQDAKGIIDGTFNQLPTTVSQFSEALQLESEALSGVTRFTAGIESVNLNQNTTGVNVQNTLSQKRMALTVQNIAENLLKPMFRKWIAYNKVFLQPEEVMRVTNQFIPFKRDDLEGNIDFNIVLKNKALDQGKLQQISMLLQQGQNLQGIFPPDALTGMTAELLELWDMPDVAERVRNYQPQPDAYKLAMLEAQIAELRAKAQRTAVDAEYKKQKVEQEALKNQDKSIDVNRKYLGLDYEMEMNKIKEQNKPSYLASAVNSSKV